MEQDCHAAVFLILFPPLFSHVDAASEAWGEQKKLICFWLGQLCCISVSSFVRSFPPVLFTSTIFPHVGKISAASLHFFFILIFPGVSFLWVAFKVTEISHAFGLVHSFKWPGRALSDQALFNVWELMLLISSTDKWKNWASCKLIS